MIILIIFRKRFYLRWLIEPHFRIALLKRWRHSSAAQIRDLRRAAVISLSKRAALPVEVLKALVTRLGDEDLEDVQDIANQILRTHAALPDDVVKAMAAWLDDKDLQRAVGQDLGDRTALPAEVLEVVAARLSDKNRTCDGSPLQRLSARRALGTRATLSNEVLKAPALRLGDEDFHVRLPDEVLKALALRLSDQSSDVRAAATEALGRRVVLLDEMFKTLVSRLSDKSSLVRGAAATALGGRVALPQSVGIWTLGTMYNLILRNLLVLAVGKTSVVLFSCISTVEMIGNLVIPPLIAQVFKFGL
ncbi:hypothetical protein MY4038_005650 [Beauveria bassiana]